MYPEWNSVFADSGYKPLIFTPDFNWHFQKPELYKHFFIDFYNQVALLPSDYEARKAFITNSINIAIETFLDINEAGVFLDPNSDGSHLYHWLNAINIYERIKGERA